MNRTLSKPNYYRVVIRLVAVLAVGLSLAWAPCAQAAGNVEVSVEDGDLIIRGDDRDNNIIVTAGNVTGRAGTTVNGGGETVTDDIDIKMKGGDDFVRVDIVLVSDDLKVSMGSGDDIIELLEVRVSDETQIATGDGNDIVFIDGVLSRSEEFIRSDFVDKFTVETGDDEDLVEINHAIFRDEVDVKLGSGIDGVCSHASEYQRPDETSFDGGEPAGEEFFLLVEVPVIVTGFEDGSPDDCSFLGGREF